MTNPPRSSIWAAGGIVYRGTKKRPEFLIVHRSGYDDWSLPKGKVEAKESFLDAALRETLEETGQVVRKPRFVGSTSYTTPQGAAKVVRWWLGRAGDGEFRPCAEVDRGEWLPPRAARKRLSYEGERNVVDRATALVASKRSGTIYLTRHGLAGVKPLWKKQDWLRPLDRNGLRQARHIHLSLATLPVTRVVTSHYKRCVDTIRPLAKAEGIPIEKDRRLGAKGDVDTLLGMFRELEEAAAVVCTHGEIIGDVIGKLAADGVPLDGPLEWRKGSVWVLQTTKGAVTRGRYLEPF